MMTQLVMTYTAGDLYTYSCDVALPIISDDPVQALCDFEAAYDKANTPEYSILPKEFSFSGHTFRCDAFQEDGVYYAPSFLTIDEWFKSHNQAYDWSKD